VESSFVIPTWGSWLLRPFSNWRRAKLALPQANRRSICQCRLATRSLRARTPPPLQFTTRGFRVLNTAHVVDDCFRRLWRRAFPNKPGCHERSPCDKTAPDTLRCSRFAQRMTDQLTSLSSVDGSVAGHRDERPTRPWLLRPAIPSSRFATVYR
jgi:hypothetical protein